MEKQAFVNDDLMTSISEECHKKIQPLDKIFALRTAGKFHESIEVAKECVNAKAALIAFYCRLTAGSAYIADGDYKSGTHQLLSAAGLVEHDHELAAFDRLPNFTLISPSQFSGSEIEHLRRLGIAIDEAIAEQDLCPTDIPAFSLPYKNVPPGTWITTIFKDGGKVLNQTKTVGDFRVDVEIEGRSIQMAIDTGSGESFLSRQQAEELGLQIIPAGFPAKSVDGSVFNADMAQASIHLGPFHGKRTFLVVDQAPEFSNILGLDILMCFKRIAFDVERHRMTFGTEAIQAHANDSCRPMWFSAGSAVPMTAVLTSVGVYGQRKTFNLDTGNDAVQINDMFAAYLTNNGIKPHLENEERQGVGPRKMLSVRHYDGVPIALAGRDVRSVDLIFVEPSTFASDLVGTPKTFGKGAFLFDFQSGQFCTRD